MGDLVVWDGGREVWGGRRGSMEERWVYFTAL